jgi:hypothetical protein
MKTIIHRVFAKKDEPSEASSQPSGISSELTASDIENYYLRIIVDCLRRMLVPTDSIEVGVKRAGVGASGLSAFAGYVRIVKWDAVLTPVLLQNIAVIDARIRKVVDASAILEHTHFAGLWFQATSTTEGAPRQLLGVPGDAMQQPATGTKG